MESILKNSERFSRILRKLGFNGTIRYDPDIDKFDDIGEEAEEAITEATGDCGMRKNDWDVKKFLKGIHDKNKHSKLIAEQFGVMSEREWKIMLCGWSACATQNGLPNITTESDEVPAAASRKDTAE